ncbi:MAG: hypothetical protein ACKVP3_13245 [Hyphomicrobiaceae bacterium]
MAGLLVVKVKFTAKGDRDRNDYTIPVLLDLPCRSSRRRGDMGVRVRLKELFGTLSPDFVDASMRQLLKLAVLPGHGVATSTSLSAALALIASLAPRDEAQASLAIHIACLHTASLGVLVRTTDAVSERRVIAMASVAAKLERAFQGAIDNYYRMQRGATQVVRIERVEVQSGAQAIVGVVGSK